MLAIFDGPEEAGKTTICHKIMESCSNEVVYIHHGKGDSNYKRIQSDLELVEANPDILYLFDRWWPSELVYRPHDGHPPSLELDPWHLEEVYGKRADKQGFRFLVLEEPEILQARRDATPGGYAGIDIDPAHERQMYQMICSPQWIRTTSKIFNLGWFHTILQEKHSYMRRDRLMQELIDNQPEIKPWRRGDDCLPVPIPWFRRIFK